MIATITAVAIIAIIVTLYARMIHWTNRAVVAEEQVRQLSSTEASRPGLIKDVDYVLEKTPVDGSKTVKLAISITDAGYDKLANHATALLRARVNIALEAMKRDGQQ